MDRLGIVVTGRGVITTAPDTASVSMGVSVKRSTAGAAVADAAALTQQMLPALVAAGVRERDLRTSQYSVGPEYRYPPNGTPIADGVRAAHSIVAIVRDIDAVGAVLDAATSAGGDEFTVHGVSFSLHDDAAARTAARELAFADARTQAAHFAQLAGRQLGDVEAITQTEPTAPVVALAMAREASFGASGTPMQPGEIETVAVVTTRWSFAD